MLIPRFHDPSILEVDDLPEMLNIDSQPKVMGIWYPSNHRNSRIIPSKLPLSRKDQGGFLSFHEALSSYFLMQAG